MKTKWTKASVVAVTTCALLLQGSVVVHKTEYASAASISNSTVSKSIKLNANSTIAIHNAQFLMQDSGRVLAYTVQITNNGNSELSLDDYWIRVKTNSGKSFSTKISELDKNIKTVAPRSSKTITYYSYVDNSTKLSDFLFEIIAWDFSVANYERQLGIIQYPKGTSEQTAINNSASLLINNMKLLASVSQYTMTQDNTNAYLQINFKIENQGLNVVDLTNLNLFVQTSDSAVYSINAGDISGVILQPKQQRLFTMHVALPKSLLGKPLTLVPAIKEATSGVMLPAASFALPAVKDTTYTDSGKAKAIYISGEQVNTFVDNAFFERNNASSNVSIQFALRNTGKQAVNYPSLSFSIVTADGVVYPLDYKKSDEALTKLLPGLREGINISGTVPSSVDLSKTKLLVRGGVEEKSEGYVLGSYQFVSSQQAGTIGSTYKYGDYGVKINSITRTATASDDVLVADIEVTNLSDNSKIVPNFSGYFMINGVKLDLTTNKAALDSKVTIAPRSTYNFVVYTSIPYTTSIDNVSFILSDKPTGSESEKTVYRFNGQKLSEIDSLNSSGVYSLNIAGRHAEAKLTRTALYSGLTENYFYAEFDVTNKESRSTQLSDYNGYLTDETGEVIPVTFSEMKQKTSVNGKVLVSAWAKVKKGTEIENYDFVFGQTVSNSGEEEKENNLIIKPVKLKLDGNDTDGIKTSLTDIPLPGYDLSLHRVNAILNVEGMYTVTGLKLLFDYNLEREESYDYIAGDHKLMIEFVDQGSGKATYSKQFSLTVPANGEERLQEAINQSMEIKFEDTLIQSKIQAYDKYKLNVYHVFQDAKILIASKDLKWFTIE